MSKHNLYSRRWVLRRLAIPTHIDKETRLVAARYGIYRMVLHLTFWKNRTEVYISIAGTWQQMTHVINWQWIEDRIREEDLFIQQGGYDVPRNNHLLVAAAHTKRDHSRLRTRPARRLAKALQLE